MSLNLRADGVLALARQTFRKIDLELPAVLLDELAAVDEQFDPAKLEFRPADLAAAVTAAIKAGKDPAADSTVKALLVRKQLADLAPALAAERDDRRAETLREHVGTLIEAMRPVVEAADRALVEARQALPTLDVADAQSVSRLRPEQMLVWGQARDAVNRVDQVLSLWRTMATATGLAPIDPREALLIVADLDHEQLNALPRDARGSTAAVVSSLAQAGHRLDLATVDGFLARVAQVERQAAEFENAATLARRSQRDPALLRTA